MSTWPILLLEVGLALTVLYLSKKQPFPGPSRRLGWVLLSVGLLFILGETAPRPVSIRAHYAVLLILGAIGLVKGINNMLIIRQEVLVAPICGILFCVGAVGFMSEEWQNMTSFEQIFSFLTVVVLAGGEVWLVFRGLLIGRLPLAWSQAGLVALRRGVISGEHGAIWCFERAWDLDEEHLNPMAWIALERIYKYLGNEEQHAYWSERLSESGGEGAVAKEWISAIEESLYDLKPMTE